MNTPWADGISIYPTFDTERDWRAHEFSQAEKERRRGPDFPKSGSPSYEMDQRALPQLLDLLGTHDVKAIFFVTGEFCEYNPGLVGDIDAAGHDLGVHTHPQLHPAFEGDHVNDLDAGMLADYDSPDIHTMIGRDYDMLREAGVDTDHFRAGNLSFSLDIARQLKALGLTHDHSIRMAIAKDVAKIPLYLRVRRLGLRETPVVLNPAYIHRAEHNRLKPYHHVFSAAFGGTLNLHPMVFGNENLDLDDDYRRLEQYLSRCTHRLGDGVDDVVENAATHP
ncbi:polysaccharide deacetylase family protein [Halorientalis litorea]|uniref:polysaccharide deacetylase family protein n=1 Tax=Halorientalis litorea TaxID=2931977 RepID=UPI001FF48527|nr:polysaccharide deacetylase family protein [Halorientalis litorea]